MLIPPVIDYQTSDPKAVIPPRSIDLLIDTTGAAMQYLPLLNPKTGAVVTFSILPSGETLQNASMMRLTPDGRDKARVPMPIRLVLNVLDWVRRMHAACYGVGYTAFFLDANGEDLESIRQWFDEGRLRTVVGATAQCKDVDAVRDACQMVYRGRGGVGKSVILFQ